jgi:hypothetical protein
MVYIDSSSTTQCSSMCIASEALYKGKEVEFEEPSEKGNSIQNTLRNAKDQSHYYACA